MRSRHSRSAIPSPARASSTARRVSASASPSSSSSAVCVALLRAPAGRPLGLPDRPFLNRPSGLPDRPFRNRPRASLSSCFCNESTSTPFSFAITAPTSRARLWLAEYDTNMAILALLNRKCFRGLCVITRGCSGGVTPDLGGNFTGLVGVPCHCSRRHGQVSRVIPSNVAPAPKPPLWMHPGPPRGTERHRLAQSRHPTGVPLVAALDLLAATQPPRSEWLFLPRCGPCSVRRAAGDHK